MVTNRNGPLSPVGDNTGARLGRWGPIPRLFRRNNILKKPDGEARPGASARRAGAQNRLTEGQPKPKKH